MLRPKKQAWTVDEFLNWEEQQPERWELPELGYALTFEEAFEGLPEDLSGG